jgi:hypothetical protein
MSVREPKKMEFNDIAEYNQWVSSKYCFDDSIRICGLNILDDGKVIASYIKLY